MTEHDSPSTDTDIDATRMADDRPDGGAAAVDARMDQVAAELQSQMRMANRRIRKRAARLFDPSRARTGAQRRA